MLSLLLLVFNCPVFLPVLGANVVRMETFEPAHNWLSMETSVDSLLSVLHFSVKVTSPQALYLVSKATLANPYPYPLSKRSLADFPRSEYFGGIIFSFIGLCGVNLLDDIIELCEFLAFFISLTKTNAHLLC